MKSSIRISNRGNTIRFTGAAAAEAFKALTQRNKDDITGDFCSHPGCGYADGKPCHGCGRIVQPAWLFTNLPNPDYIVLAVIFAGVIYFGCAVLLGLIAAIWEAQDWKWRWK